MPRKMDDVLEWEHSDRDDFNQYLYHLHKQKFTSDRMDRRREERGG